MRGVGVLARQARGWGKAGAVGGAAGCAGVPFVGAIAVIAALAWWRGRRSRQALSCFAQTGRTRLRVLVAGDEPYPGRFRRGWLEVDGATVVLQCDSPREADVRLPGGPLRLVRTRLGGDRDRLPRKDAVEYVVFHLVDGSGGRLEVAVRDDEEEYTVAVLRGLDVLLGPAHAEVLEPADRPVLSAVPLWTRGVAALALVAATVVAVLWVMAQPVPVSVLESADEYDYCAVGWQDPFDGATARQAEISCYDEQPGDTIAGLALDRPFRGEVFDLDSFPVLLGAAGVVLAVAVGSTAVRVVRLRRRVRPEPPTGGRVPLEKAVVAEADLDLSDLDADRLVRALVADVARRRAAVERWGDTGSKRPALQTPDEAVGRAWWSRGGPRGVVLARARLAAGALLPSSSVCSEDGRLSPAGSARRVRPRPWSPTRARRTAAAAPPGRPRRVVRGPLGGHARHGRRARR